jgi:hypothetical protein
MKFLFGILLMSQAAFAQAPGVNDPSRADLNMLRREGKMVSIQIIPKKPIQIYVVGREEAQFDPSKLTLVVRRLSPGPKAIIESVREGDHFILPESLSSQQHTDLEITAKTPSKSETFHFKIKNKLP